MAQEYTDIQKEILLKHSPQDEMKILEKYRKAYVQQTFDLPLSEGKHGQLGIILPEGWTWNFKDICIFCQ